MGNFPSTAEHVGSIDAIILMHSMCVCPEVHVPSLHAWHTTRQTDTLCYYIKICKIVVFIITNANVDYTIIHLSNDISPS